MMSINEETRGRILTAANELYDQAGRADFPTVDAVRRLSKTGMGDASSVMKEWRKMQSATAVPVAVAVPDRVQQASQAALLTIWGEAQEIAHENLKAAQVAWDAERNEAETLRGQMSSAFEIQAAELEAAQIRILELEANAKTAAAELADVRDSAREEGIQSRVEATKLRVQLDAAQEQQAALRLRIVGFEANAKTAATELVDVRDSSREEARQAREEAAKLRGQLDATQEQQAALMHALAQRNAKGGPTALAPKSTTKTIKAYTVGTL